MSMLSRIADKNPMSTLYQEAGLAAEIRRSLNCILLGNIFGSMNGIICGGGTTAMIGLANQLGAGDLALGILASVPQIAALFQIPFSMLVNRTHKRKRYMLTYGILCRVLWLTFGFIPLLMPVAPPLLPLWLLIFLLGVSSCCGAFINVCWFPWLSDLLPMRIRGRWLSVREMILSACNMLFGLFSAYLLDTLPPENRYIVAFLIGGACGVVDMVCFGFCKEVYSAPPRKLHFSTLFKGVLKDKPFMRLVVMWTVWSFTTNLSGVYLFPYAMNELGLSFMQVMIFGTMAAALGTILMMPFWGRMQDQYGCRSVMLVAAAISSVSPAFFLLSSPGSVWPLFLHNFLGTLFSSGTVLAVNSMQLSYSPDEMRPSYIAVFSCITSLCGGMLGSLAGGALLENWHAAGLFVGSFDRYQALILLSVVLRLGFALLLVPPLPNDREGGTPKDVLRHLNPFAALRKHL